MANVELVMPSRTKYGERPSDDRREIMRICCGIYERRMPKTMNMERTVIGTSGWATAEQSSVGAKKSVPNDEVSQGLAIFAAELGRIFGFYEMRVHSRAESMLS